MEAYVIFKETCSDNNNYIYEQYITAIERLERTDTYAYDLQTLRIVKIKVYSEVLKVRIPIINISEEDYFTIHANDKLTIHYNTYLYKICRNAICKQNAYINKLIIQLVQRRNYRFITKNVKLINRHNYFIVLRSKNRYILCRINLNVSYVKLMGTLAIKNI